MEEEFRPIAGLEDKYQVSDQGNVKSLRSGRLLKLTVMSGRSKYRVVCIGGRTRYVHQLVAEAFHGPRPAGLLCLHRDDDKANNCAANLYWGTAAQNTADCIKNGRRPEQVRWEHWVSFDEWVKNRPQTA